MRAHSEVIAFGLWWIALSVAIGWGLWTVPTLLPTSHPYSLRNSMFLVPVLAAMLAARGHTWKRKLTFALLALGIFLLADLAAVLSGLQSMSVNARYFGTGFWRSLLVVAYSTFIAAYPLVCLALFVGKKPARLWSKDGR